MNGALIKQRLSQYGAAWFLSFLVVFLGCLIAVMGFKAPFAGVADLLLKVALSLLALATAAVLVLTVFARESVGSKAAVILLGLVLVLPLLWAPVLGAVLAARITGQAVEYSGVYAQFRIVIGELVYPLGQTIFSGAAREWVWNAFQAIAAVIGFIASALQIWSFLRKRGARPHAA